MYSRQFGFLKLNSPEQTKKKALVVRAIKYLERMLIQAQAEKQRLKADSIKESSEKSKENKDEDNGISIDPKTYCKLGHFHLLLEDYNKGIASYMYNKIFLIILNQTIYNINLFIYNINLFFYSNVCISEILFFKK